MSDAFHWYSLTVPTFTVERVAPWTDGRVQVVPSNGPYDTEAVVPDWSVAKFTITCRPTRSVRYGARVRCVS